MSSSRALLFLLSSSSSSFGRSFLCRSVPLCASSSFPPPLLSKEQRERERETRAREEINARKFRTKTKRRLRVFGRRSMMSFFFSSYSCDVFLLRERKTNRRTRKRRR